MKLRSKCGAALFCMPGWLHHAVANATAKRAVLPTRFASAGIGISPGQALRRASLRGSRRDFACAYLTTARKLGKMSRDHLRARSRLCFALPSSPSPRSCRSGPDRSFYSRTCPRRCLACASVLRRRLPIKKAARCRTALALIHEEENRTVKNTTHPIMTGFNPFGAGLLERNLQKSHKKIVEGRGHNPSVGQVY